MSKKRYHIIATVYDKKGNVLSVGVNSYDKTHPLQAKYAMMCGLPDKQFLHAEVAAILKLQKPWKAHGIKVERYDSNGNPACAKPCVICQKVIESVGIKEILWTE